MTRAIYKRFSDQLFTSQRSALCRDTIFKPSFLPVHTINKPHFHSFHKITWPCFCRPVRFSSHVFVNSGHDNSARFDMVLPIPAPRLRDIQAMKLGRDRDIRATVRRYSGHVFSCNIPKILSIPAANLIIICLINNITALLSFFGEGK